jgi:hypothetical protein
MARLARVSLAVTIVCALAVQQLRVQPFPAGVGQTVTVRAGTDSAPIAALAVVVERPDGVTTSCGVTDAAGEVRFVPDVAGAHVVVAAIGGVRTLAPLAVVPARSRWPLALGSVPLGLALLWWHLSRRRRVAPQ